MEEILGLLIPVSFAVMLVVEHFFAAKPLPKVRFWLFKGLVFFSFTGVVNAQWALYSAPSAIHRLSSITPLQTVSR